jgi:hypothetical protein
MDQTFTPAKAAKHAGCGRSSVMRALQNRDLIGDRDNKNRWKITLQALEKWMENRPDIDRTVTDTAPTSDQDSGRSDLILQLTRDHSAAEATIIELRSQLERNDDRNTAEIDRLEKIIDRLTEVQPSLLQRIFSSRK